MGRVSTVIVIFFTLIVSQAYRFRTVWHHKDKVVSYRARKDSLSPTRRAVSRIDDEQVDGIEEDNDGGQRGKSLLDNDGNVHIANWNDDYQKRTKHLKPSDAKWLNALVSFNAHLAESNSQNEKPSLSIYKGILQTAKDCKKFAEAFDLYESMLRIYPSMHDITVYDLVARTHYEAGDHVGVIRVATKLLNETFNTVPISIATKTATTSMAQSSNLTGDTEALDKLLHLALKSCNELIRIESKLSVNTNNFGVRKRASMASPQTVGGWHLAVRLIEIVLRRQLFLSDRSKKQFLRLFQCKNPLHVSVLSNLVIQYPAFVTGPLLSEKTAESLIFILHERQPATALRVLYALLSFDDSAESIVGSSSDTSAYTQHPVTSKSLGLSMKAIEYIRMSILHNSTSPNLPEVVSVHAQRSAMETMRSLKVYLGYLLKDCNIRQTSNDDGVRILFDNTVLIQLLHYARNFARGPNAAPGSLSGVLVVNAMSACKHSDDWRAALDVYNIAARSSPELIDGSLKGSHETDPYTSLLSPLLVGQILVMLAKSGAEGPCLQTFCSSLEKGVMPTSLTIDRVFLYLSKAGAYQALLQIMDQLNRYKVPIPDYATNCFVAACEKAKSYHRLLALYKVKIFPQQLDAYSVSVLIKACTLVCEDLVTESMKKKESTTPHHVGVSMLSEQPVSQSQKGAQDARANNDKSTFTRGSGDMLGSSQWKDAKDASVDSIAEEKPLYTQRLMQVINESKATVFVDLAVHILIDAMRVGIAIDEKILQQVFGLLTSTGNALSAVELLVLLESLDTIPQSSSSSSSSSSSKGNGRIGYRIIDRRTEQVNPDAKQRNARHNVRNETLFSDLEYLLTQGSESPGERNDTMSASLGKLVKMVQRPLGVYQRLYNAAVCSLARSGAPQDALRLMLSFIQRGGVETCEMYSAIISGLKTSESADSATPSGDVIAMDNVLGLRRVKIAEILIGVYESRIEAGKEGQSVDDDNGDGRHNSDNSDDSSYGSKSRMEWRQRSNKGLTPSVRVENKQVITMGDEHRFTPVQLSISPYNALLSLYSLSDIQEDTRAAGISDTLTRIIDRSLSWDAYTYSAVMCRNENHDEVLDLYTDMVSTGLTPIVNSVHEALRSCVRLRCGTYAYHLLTQLWADLDSSNIHDGSSASREQVMFAQTKSCANRKKPAQKLLPKVEPDHTMCSSALQAIYREAAMNRKRYDGDDDGRNGDDLDNNDTEGNAYFDSGGHHGDHVGDDLSTSNTKATRRLLSSMTNQSVDMYPGYESLSLLSQMQSRGLNPSEDQCILVLKTLEMLGNSAKSVNLLTQMRLRGVHIGASALNIVMRTCGRDGKPAVAVKLFSVLPSLISMQLDVDSYMIAISMTCSPGMRNATLAYGIAMDMLISRSIAQTAMKSDYMIALQQVLPLLESEGMYEQSATLCEALMMRLEKCTDESCAVDDDEGDDISSIDSVREQIQSQPRGSFKDGKKARSRADPKSSSSALGSDGVKRDSYGYAIEPRQVTPASTDLRITAPSLMRADEVNGAADEPSKRQKSAVSDDVSTTETSRMSESIPTSNEAVSKVPNLVLDLHGYPITIARAAVRTVLYKAQVQYIDTQIALQRKRVEAMVHKMAAKRRDTTSDASAQNTSIVSEDAQAPIYVADNGDGGDLTDENAYMNVVESIQTEKPLLGNLELITGIGRGSASQESTIKPHVKEWLARQFSPPLRAVELTDNPGRLIVPERDLRDWIECGVELPIQPREPPE